MARPPNTQAASRRVLIWMRRTLPAVIVLTLVNLSLCVRIRLLFQLFQVCIESVLLSVRAHQVWEDGRTP